jgi:hypothetical protein
MTTINDNVYLLFEDPDNSSKLNQIMLTFGESSIEKQASVSI